MFGLTWIIKRHSMARLSVIVRIDPAHLALIRESAEALEAAGCDDIIADLVARGAFRESVQTVVERGVMTARFGPMTELLLRECIDVATRRGWSQSMKRGWIEQMVRVAGFGESGVS